MESTRSKARGLRTAAEGAQKNIRLRRGLLRRRGAPRRHLPHRSRCARAAEMTFIRVFEEVHVIDEDGREVAAYTREMDPLNYVLIKGPDKAASVTHVRRI